MVVQYDRMIRDMGKEFDAVFKKAHKSGYRGINVNSPYKELAVQGLSSTTRWCGRSGVNTVLFDAGGLRGQKTLLEPRGDLSRVQSDIKPGIVCLIGTGGVSRALAFALIALGTTEIRLVDCDRAKAEGLAADPRAVSDAPPVIVFAEAAAVAAGAAGLLNPGQHSRLWRHTAASTAMA